MPKEFLHRAYVVTVVDEHPVPSVPATGYSVEFFDMTGNTVAVVTLPVNNLRVLTGAAS